MKLGPLSAFNKKNTMKSLQELWRRRHFPSKDRFGAEQSESWVSDA